MNKKLLNIGTILLTIIIGILQFLPKESNNHIVKWLISYSVWIVISFGALIVIVHFLDIFIEEDKRKKKWLKRFLKYIIDTHLGGSNYHTRITILRPRLGVSIIFPYICHVIVLNFISNFRDKKWAIVLKNIPCRLFSNYLTVYVRYSYPSQKHSYTHFLLEKKNGKENGVAEKCYREGLAFQVNAPCISSFELAKSIDDNHRQNKSLIRKYMKDSYISEENYLSVLAMNRKSNNIYAVPIPQEDQKIWGVLVVDNDEDRKVSFEDQLQDYIQHYIKLTAFTVTNYNY